jgi:hypothetical protein
VVPVFSAQGTNHEGSPVPALNGVEELQVDSPDPFTHTEFGSNSFRISTIMDRSILPTLSDWITLSEDSGLDFEPPKRGEEGHVRLRIVANWNVPHETIESVDAVIYAVDRSGKWHIIAGADPSSREPDDSGDTVLSFGDSNSLLVDEGERVLDIDLPVPPVTDDPATDLVAATYFVAKLPYADRSLPESPPSGNFSLPSTP